MAQRLDILVPFLNERESVAGFSALASELAAQVKQRFDLDTHFIFIDDGSTDEGGALYGEHMTGHWSLITLARNFGKETAILAGLDHCDQGVPRHDVIAGQFSRPGIHTVRLAACVTHKACHPRQPRCRLG